MAKHAKKNRRLDAVEITRRAMRAAAWQEKVAAFQDGRRLRATTIPSRRAHEAIDWRKDHGL